LAILDLFGRGGNSDRGLSARLSGVRTSRNKKRSKTALLLSHFHLIPENVHRRI